MSPATLSQFGIDEVEWVKGSLILLYIGSTVGVLVGVFLEKEEFTPSTNKTGWLLLLWSLAAEILSGGLIFAADARITNLQRAEIATLEFQIAPRRLSAEQRQALTILRPAIGQKVRVSSYALDVESALFASQIVAALRAANIAVEPSILNELPIGVLSTGVRVFGENTDLVSSLLRAISGDGRTAVSPEAPARAPMSMLLGNAGSAAGGAGIAATIFVGTKPMQQ